MYQRNLLSYYRSNKGSLLSLSSVIVDFLDGQHKVIHLYLID